MNSLQQPYYFLCLLVSVLFLCAGCSSFGTYNPATERRELILISTSEEVAMGTSINRDIKQKYPLLEEGELFTKVERIGKRLAQVSDRQDYSYHFHVIDKEEMNAFTTPGGHVYFYTGLLNKLQSDDEIAFVLAHEIGHCSARHTIKKFQAALGYDLISSIVLGYIGEGTQRIASISSGTVMNIVFSSYGRKDEYEADRLGLKYMYLAGFDTEGARGALNVLLKENKEGKGAPLILRTHPYLEDRIKAADAEITSVKKRFTDPS